MIYCKLLTRTDAHWQKNSVLHYLMFTSSEIHTYILQHLSADIIPWQIEDGLQFQHQVKQEGLVTILKQLDFTQCVKMNMDGKICSQVLWQGVHQNFLIYKQTVSMTKIMFVYTISSTSESKVFQIPKINTKGHKRINQVNTQALPDKYYNIVKKSF